MNISIPQLIEGLKELFPGCSESELSEESTLADLPDWDSMSVVNLQTFLHQQFQVEVPMEMLADETSLQEVISFLAAPMPQGAAC